MHFRRSRKVSCAGSYLKNDKLFWDVLEAGALEGSEYDISGGEDRACWHGWRSMSKKLRYFIKVGDEICIMYCR